MGLKIVKGTPFAFFHLFGHFCINPVKHVVFEKTNLYFIIFFFVKN